MNNLYPHLSDKPDFPGSGRSLYKQIPGEFDESRWDSGATLTLLSVPWGVYDPQTMTDRPGFDTVEERDAWFAQRIADTTKISESHVLDTMVRYQIDSYIDVPFTFDYAARYNYLIVDYPDAPVPGGATGIRKWFYHVTAIDYRSPSATRLELVPDWWTTCAPTMSISHMILARGHAPVAETDAETYLTSPLENSKYLLAPDVDYGDSGIVASSSDTVINSGTVWAVICLRGVPITGTFADYATLPFDNSTFVEGVPADYQFAVQTSQLEGFLNSWQQNAPSSMQAMDALYFCGESLLAFDGSATVFGYSIRTGAHGGTLDISIDLTQDKFAYPDDIKHLAKLYTAPYSHIEVTTENGNVIPISVENLNGGQLGISCALNGAFPWLRVSANMYGYSGASKTLTFSTASQHEFKSGGKWYETLMDWGVPCYRIHQSNAQAYDYRTHYSRVQAQNNMNTAYSNAIASNATAKTNADNSANTAVANNAVVTANNTEAAATANAYALQSASVSNTKLAADCDSDNATSTAITGLQNDMIAITTANNQAVQAGHTVVNAISSAATGSLSGIGAMTGTVNTAIDFISSNAAAAVSQSSNENAAAIARTNALEKTLHSATFTADSYAISSNSNNALTTIRNEAATETTANSAQLTKTNASNTKMTADANTSRTKANAENAIANQVNEAGQQAPLAYGTAQDGMFSTTRPMLVSVNFVTETASAIRQAATQFLRYGYALGQAWEFESWNLMRNFTYWQVSDIWATGIDAVPEEAQDSVRKMLYDGVTVWRNPDKIGKVSIYDN